MLNYHTTQHMQKACTIFMNLPLESYKHRINIRKRENKTKCTLFQFTLNNISDHNIIKYVIGMLEEFFNKKGCIQCETFEKNVITIVFIM